MHVISPEISHRHQALDLTASSLSPRAKGSPSRRRVWAVRLVLASALAVGLAYVPYELIDGTGARKAAELRAQHRRLVEASRELSEENRRLELEIQALERDSSALEDIARSELGMVYPGELIIRIEGEP